MVETIDLGAGEELVLREGRRGGEARSWRDEIELRRGGAAVWTVRVALFTRAFDHLAEADAESVVVAGQPPGSAYFALQVLGRADGKLRWSTTPRKQPALWRLDRGELFELTATHVHRYDARSGTTLWSHALEPGAAMRGILPAEADVTLVGADGRDVRLDRASGAPR
ncbi:MAG TPA: PQQ-binding-like beta-propeller repeat protein [Kofleriaceae bacterium]|nr:PQQ-binding-like beta-propeller repeat protein [Kofleriaceae bacterium]